MKKNDDVRTPSAVVDDHNWSTNSHIKGISKDMVRANGRNHMEQIPNAVVGFLQTLWLPTGVIGGDRIAVCWI